jgi:hypothetical protein
MEQKESIIANTGCPVYWWDVFGRIGDECSPRHLSKTAKR